MSAPALGRKPVMRPRGWLLVPLFLARDAMRVVARRLRLSLLRQRRRVYGVLPQPGAATAPRQRVLAVVTHVLAEAELRNAERGAARARGLAQTIDALLCSFSHHDLTLVINTYRDREALAGLPAYQRERCEVVTHESGDPMLVEFAAQDVFLERKAAFDWFLFLEDDILIQDSCFIEKLAEFNQRVPEEDALLLPHPFELNRGMKYYIDRDTAYKGWGHEDGSDVEDVINPLTTITFASGIALVRLTFAEFTNPHASCYCLNREQLERWDRTGRRWYRQVLWVGPLESAATGCLFERFDLYKPHPANKWYLEVRHLGEKYSDRFRSFAGP